MKLHFRKATAEDTDLLINTRMEVLQSVSDGYGEPLHPDTEQETRRYFEDHLNKDYESYIVYVEEEWVACGGICYTQIIPTLENYTGKGAVIVNMYTRPDWRGKSIAYQLLDVLVQAAMARGVNEISLEATPVGLSLYKKYGFEVNEEAMQLPYRRLKDRKEE